MSKKKSKKERKLLRFQKERQRREVTLSPVPEFDPIKFMFKPGVSNEIELLKGKAFDHTRDLLVIPRRKLDLFIFRPTLSIVLDCYELAIIRSYGGRSLF